MPWKKVEAWNFFSVGLFVGFLVSHPFWGRLVREKALEILRKKPISLEDSKPGNLNKKAGGTAGWAVPALREALFRVDLFFIQSISN